MRVVLRTRGRWGLQQCVGRRKFAFHRRPTSSQNILAMGLLGRTVQRRQADNSSRIVQNVSVDSSAPAPKGSPFRKARVPQAAPYPEAEAPYRRQRYL